MSSLVGTGTESLAIYFPFQRKSFYAAGRFWVFYSDGVNMVYCTSSDGLVWTAAITIREGLGGYRFSIWFDGTYLHYAYVRRISSTPLYYRRGLPNSDGTITWSAAEQPAVAGGATLVYLDPFVSVDSDGYAWIGYLQYDAGIFHPYVTMSGNNDGTWGATPGGFPYQFPHHAENRQSRISPIPLTDNKMLAVYAYNGLTEKAKARLWNGLAWGSEVLTSPYIHSTFHFSAVAEGDDVHLVFMNRSRDIIYIKYVYSTNSFTAGENLIPGGAYTATPVISRASNNDLYIFWAGNPAPDNLYYLKYTAENDAWEPAAVKWESEEEQLTSRNHLTCFYKMYSGFIGLAYMTKKSSPYNVKFKYIAPPPPPGVPPGPGEPGSPGVPEPTPEPEIASNALTSSGSRHTTPKEGSKGKSQRFKKTRINRHITWVPVVITRA